MPRSVLITGASSGIGAATATKLAETGWRVFAGVRKVAAAPAGTTPILIDVSDRASISGAATEVARLLEGNGLDALVNNAGIGQVAPLEFVSPEDLQAIFSVNVFGLVSVTQAFLPHLRLARGRIVNLSSVGGLITIPFGGGLCATKHAVEAISEAMRMELLPAGVNVIIIRPASIHSPAADKLAVDTERVIAALPPEGRDRYEQSLRHFVQRMTEEENAGSPPEVVGETILHALSADHPATHYDVGKGSRILTLLAEWVPDKLRDQILLKKLGLPDHAP